MGKVSRAAYRALNCLSFNLCFFVFDPMAPALCMV
jgi:hypothetical protein